MCQRPNRLWRHSESFLKRAQMVMNQAESCPPETPLPPRESIFLSLAFWLTLLLASAMYAVLCLSPRLSEHARLTRQSYELQFEAEQRSQEIRHLRRVAQAMQQDAEFISRIARNEFSLAEDGSQQIQVATELGYDARVPGPSQGKRDYVDPWYLDLIELLCNRTSLRNQWTWSILGLYFFAFVFLNEGMCSGRCARQTLRHLLSFGQRYRISTQKID